MSLIALAVGATLQLETGLVAMERPSDDTYVERAMPGKTTERYDTVAFGLSGVFTLGQARGPRLELGWRNLGDQHSSGPIIDDNQYFHCRDAHIPFPAAQQYWHSEGNEQQFFAELGFRFPVPAKLTLTPSIGIAENRITWHANAVFVQSWNGWKDGQSWELRSKTQVHPAPFVGLTLSGEHVGVGVYYLNTDPMRNLAIDGEYPGQGRNAIYGRLTYSF